MSALPIAAPLDIKAASSANSIAIGFIKNPDDSFVFVGSLIADIEKVFGLNLLDELTFLDQQQKLAKFLRFLSAQQIPQPIESS